MCIDYNNYFILFLFFCYLFAKTLKLYNKTTNDIFQSQGYSYG